MPVDWRPPMFDPSLGLHLKEGIVRALVERLAEARKINQQIEAEFEHELKLVGKEAAERVRRITQHSAPVFIDDYRLRACR